MFSDLCFPFLEFHVGRVAFDAFFERPLCLYFTAKNPEIALSQSKAAEFYCNNLKRSVFFLKKSKNADTVLNFSYLAVKLPNFKSVDKNLPELELRVSRSFHIKIVSRKKL